MQQVVWGGWFGWCFVGLLLTVVILDFSCVGIGLCLIFHGVMVGGVGALIALFCCKDHDFGVWFCFKLVARVFGSLLCLCLVIRSV